MPLNPDAVGSTSDPVERSWTSKDALLYAVGVGAGSIDPTGLELEYTTENSKDVKQRVLPTFAVIIGGGGGGAMRNVGSFNPAMLVHGEQSITLHREIPVEGKVRTVGKVVGIYDKGSGGVIVTEAESVDASTGEPMFTTRMAAFIRGEGGFGGDRGPSSKFEAPTTAPTHTVTYQTRPDQALTYRLSGDRNPLHSDPEFAKMGGFSKPILHGLCTYGFTGRALLHSLCGGDAGRFTGMDARFSKPVIPGDELTIKIWDQGDGTAVFQTLTQNGDVVIDAGKATYKQ